MKLLASNSLDKWSTAVTVNLDGKLLAIIAFTLNLIAYATL